MEERRLKEPFPRNRRRDENGKTKNNIPIPGWFLPRDVTRSALCRADPVGQLLQPFQLLIGKSTRGAGKNFQDSGNLPIAVNWKNCDAANSCSMGNFRIKSGKFRDVLTEEWCSRIQTFF